MLDFIFWGFMNIIGNIVKFIIVFGIIGFILILPFLLKGGWLFGLILYGFLGILVVTFFIDQHNAANERFEEKMKERENNNGKRI